MILNARMYSPTPEIGFLWTALLARLRELSGDATLELLDYPPPLPLGPLWARQDKAGVFMCGLPFSLGEGAAVAVAAPVPSPVRYAGRPVYWSDLVVRTGSRYRCLADTLGARVALTTPASQSGSHALLQLHAARVTRGPVHREAVGPTVTFLANLRAVLDGAADVAPVDSFGFDLLQAHHPELTAGVRVVGHTAQMPIPLLVASAPRDDLRRALLAAHGDPPCRALMRPLLVSRFVAVDARDYATLRTVHAGAVRQWSQRPFLGVGNTALGFRVDGTLAP